MTGAKKPYFMLNKDWYFYDSEKSMYKLNTNASIEAIVSYEAFYGNIENDEELSENKTNTEDLIYQNKLSQQYDEEQQAKQIYGGF